MYECYDDKTYSQQSNVINYKLLYVNIVDIYIYIYIYIYIIHIYIYIYIIHIYIYIYIYIYMYYIYICIIYKIEFCNKIIINIDHTFIICKSITNNFTYH